ncbi:MAG: ferrochelatase, partial [Candidatus Latescibacterota bacterium]|nr:ferrochelatase [Candidatus Latescibacterota bacterium]
MSSASSAQSSKVGVLIAQLGTPAAPTAKALRPYLRQFLSDPRVIDLKWWKWLPILYLFILTRRPARSAKLYSRIWTDAGSPLLLTSQSQAEGLQQRLGENYRVILGMRYGEPSIEQAMARLQREEIERIVVLPMFPQFSCSTTASIYDAVNQA